MSGANKGCSNKTYRRRRYGSCLYGRAGSSPCVTYNKDNTYQWFNPRVKILEEQGHDPTDLHKAIDRGYQWGEEIPIGLFWRRTDLETLEEQEPVLHTGEGPLGFRSNLGVPTEQAKALVNELL